jgi:hypothetical protein
VYIRLIGNEKESLIGVRVLNDMSKRKCTADAITYTSRPSNFFVFLSIP